VWNPLKRNKKNKLTTFFENKKDRIWRVIFFIFNPLSAKKFQSESDFMSARALPSVFAAPYHFSIHSLVV